MKRAEPNHREIEICHSCRTATEAADALDNHDLIFTAAALREVFGLSHRQVYDLLHDNAPEQTHGTG